ncbi:MAG: hypothetical protein ABSA33_07090, partial [Candidatus Micrarchaeaceae archaeon]
IGPLSDSVSRPICHNTRQSLPVIKEDFMARPTSSKVAIAATPVVIAGGIEEWCIRTSTWGCPSENVDTPRAV